MQLNTETNDIERNLKTLYNLALGVVDKPCKTKPVKRTKQPEWRLPECMRQRDR